MQKGHDLFQAALAATVADSQKTGRATTFDPGVTKAKGTGTTSPVAQASRPLTPVTSTVSTCFMSYVNKFKAGNLAKHVNAWEALTSVERILSVVKSCQPEFIELPCQTQAPNETNLSNREAEIISSEIDKLLSDNQTAVFYLRNMGGTHSLTHHLLTQESVMTLQKKQLTDVKNETYP